MTLPLEQSIKERLRSLAKERETSFFQLWIYLISERFLVRLSHSNYNKNFIIKGGALLARYIPLGRETQDLDFFTKIFPRTDKTIWNTLNDICTVEIDDSFSFDVTSVKRVEHAHMKYSGFQATIIAKFGNTKTQMTLDLGFGDVVEPVLHSFQLLASQKGPLFEKEVGIQCYPLEFIFAEKLETVVFRGKHNSRMKDIYDLHELIMSNKLNDLKTDHAIRLVFEHRLTPIDALPLKFENLPVDKNWDQFIKKIKISVPLRFDFVIETINLWIKKHTSLCKKEHASHSV